MKHPRKPAIVSYCHTFLNPEMLHVYRQITGIRGFENWVVTRKQVCRDRFPYDRVSVLRPPPLRFLRRFYYQRIKREARVPLSGHEIGQLEHFAEEKDARLIHVYFGTHAARLLPYLRRESRAKIVSFHGADLSDDLSASEFNELVAHTDLFLCRSQSLREVLLEKGASPDRIRLNPTGIPLPATTRPFLAPAASAQQPLRLLQACRFIGKKGLDTAIRGTALLHRQGVPVQLTLAGEGPERPVLEALAKAEGIGEWVRFTGFLSSAELEDIMREHDLFLHPSRTTDTGDREGIPNSLLEAMACGLPVVATRHSGIPEAVTDGVEGRLLDEADPASLASAVGSLLEERTRYPEMAAAARRRVEQNFSVPSCIEKLETAYGEAIERAAARFRDAR